jgi:PKD repeat protein
VGDLKSVLAAETCSAPDFATGPQSGTLFWAEFQILLAPGGGQTFTSTFDISTEYAATNTYVWDPIGNSYTFTPYDGTYQFTNSSGPPVQEPLAVSISPTSTSVVVNQTLLFTSNVTGGTAPYSFQWFQNNTAVSGATSNSWTFSSTINASYAVFLNVTDQNGTIAESNTAVVTVNVNVKIQGDANGDGKVDGIDMMEVGNAYGTAPGSPSWNPDADVYQDGKIDGKDQAVIGLNFGKSASAS